MSEVPQEVLENLRISRAIQAALKPLGLEWLGTSMDSKEPGVLTIRVRKV